MKEQSVNTELFWSGQHDESSSLFVCDGLTQSYDSAAGITGIEAGYNLEQNQGQIYMGQRWIYSDN